MFKFFQNLASDGTLLQNKEQYLKQNDDKYEQGTSKLNSY